VLQSTEVFVAVELVQPLALVLITNAVPHVLVQEKLVLLILSVLRHLNARTMLIVNLIQKDAA
jgi:hypothetical protein